MPYKPVGIDENSHFPPRVNTALAQMFVTKPANLVDGQVPVWDADMQTWVGGAGGSGSGSGGSYDDRLPSNIDGGVWDPTTNTWVAVDPTIWHAPLYLDGGVWDTGMNRWDYGSETWLIPPDPEVNSDIDGGTPTSN